MDKDTYVILKIIWWLISRDSHRRRHTKTKPRRFSCRSGGGEIRKLRVKGVMTPSELARYVGWIIVAALALAGAAVLGEWAPWYFAWVIGTAMIILLSAFAGALYDRQARDADNEEEDQER